MMGARAALEVPLALAISVPEFAALEQVLGRTRVGDVAVQRGDPGYGRGFPDDLPSGWVEYLEPWFAGRRRFFLSWLR